MHFIACSLGGRTHESHVSQASVVEKAGPWPRWFLWTKFSLMAFVPLFALAPREAQSHILHLPVDSAGLCDYVLTSFLALALTSLLFCYPDPSSIYFVLLFCEHLLRRERGREEGRGTWLGMWSGVRCSCHEGGCQVRAFIFQGNSLACGGGVGGRSGGELPPLLYLQLVSLGNVYWGL